MCPPWSTGRRRVNPLSGTRADTVEGSVLETPCDIVIPAAMEGTLTGDVATRVTARLVVEGANGPTTPHAEAILHEAGIAVVPDLIADAGSVISSHYEWVQNHQRLPWPESDERNRVMDRLEQSWAVVAAKNPRPVTRLGVDHRHLPGPRRHASSRGDLIRYRRLRPRTRVRGRSAAHDHR